ncbi:hypothetical protein L5515_009641 [Caenorhabditis briggsae]|uniref:C-type lectin domain-containing protein n=1 Tax=Caenorhabditis briggsae TaxID=6238 RepID=A0AAE9F8Q3_CAEBR|nr:hypothetical protein L5515_009641 [Caenorhabditis briggsae]
MGFTLVLDKCLRVFDDGFPHSYAEQMQCVTIYGGTLVNIHNAIENRAVSEFAISKNLDTFWIGAFCFSNQTSSCYSDDYSGPLKYSNFHKGYPLIEKPSNGCVSMLTKGGQAGKWINSDCQKSWLPFICEIPSTIINPAYPNCRFTFNGFCYLHGYGTMDYAESYCQQNNGTIMSIQSQLENAFAQYRLLPELILLGAKRVFQNSYAWADGSIWGTFDNRNPVDRSSETVDCLGLFKLNGLWHRTDCSEKNEFYCKIPLGPKVNDSKCNSTMLMAPTEISSGDGPCTWQLVTPGAYPISIYFVEMANGTTVELYDENMQLSLEIKQSGVYFDAKTNILNVAHDGVGSFKAVVKAQTHGS